MQFRDLPSTAKWMIGLYGGAGLAAAVLSVALQPSFRILPALLLVAVAAAGARSKIALGSNSTISFLTAVVLFAVIVEGAAVAALAALCGVTIQTVSRRAATVPLHQVVFNAGMVSVTVLLTWTTYHTLSGALPLPMMPAELTATLLASFVYFLSNSVSVSLIVMATQGVSVFDVWSKHFLASAPSFLIAGLMALGAVGATQTDQLPLLAAFLSVIALTYYCSIRLAGQHAN